MFNKAHNIDFVAVLIILAVLHLFSKKVFLNFWKISIFLYFFIAFIFVILELKKALE